MKRLLLLLSFVSLTQFASAGKLSAFMSYSRFDQPNAKPYLETYLNVIGSTTVAVQNKEGKFQSKIEVLWVFKSGDSIVHFDKYNLLSPEALTAETAIPNFISQQRVTLPNGSYDVELAIRDFNTTDPATKITQHIDMNFENEKVQLSDIELLESISSTTTNTIYSKCGYELIPNANNFYPEDLTSLRFYAEVYNTAKTGNESFLVRYYLTENNGRRILNDWTMNKRETAKEVNPILAEFPIENLPSGNYEINIDVVSRDNHLLAHRQLSFQRSNQLRKPIITDALSDADLTNTFVSTITNPDTLAEMIAVLYPISDQMELRIGENQILQHDVKSMQHFLYSFWSKRDKIAPEHAWELYMIEVQKANNSYGSITNKGYKTDRGRVYLQYGPPDHISEESHDPNSWPYEIWQYYKLGSQTNRKFVFYNTELGTANFRLLHSTAKGELQEPSWELVLHNRSQQFGTDIDQENAVDTYGGKSKDNFNNPK
ncbi:MAG: GWxTD domain-containing protein [Bacteroidetes bacterium]|nr:GWxTD domain-containing protein [Bacteroidota bacterium]